jgi:hypothetical protein
VTDCPRKQLNIYISTDEESVEEKIATGNLLEIYSNQLLVVNIMF